MQPQCHASGARLGELRDPRRLCGRGARGGLDQPHRRWRVNFELPWVVRSSGTTPVEDVVFTAVRLPDEAGLSIDAISAEDGSCSVSGTTASCSFGVLAPARSARCA